MATQATSQIPRSAFVLGWLGVVPFVALSLLAVTGGVLPSGNAMRWLATYGLIILSFMGGAQWGLAMQAAGSRYGAKGAGLGISVLPALVAFGLSFLPQGQPCSDCRRLSWPCWGTTCGRRGLAQHRPGIRLSVFN